MSPDRLMSLVGLVCFLFLAWVCSSHRRRFPWRTVLSGLALQLIFALLILKTGFGRQFFSMAQLAVQKLNEVAQDGARMVFGPLADGTLLSNHWGPENGVIFAVLITSTIIVVAALSALMYHWGVLQRVVQAMAWIMQRVMRTSGSESLAAAANVFMGQTEAPLLIKPYLAGMTRSELMTMMTGGMATIAGGVAVIYAGLGARAGDLLSASVMSAPASLLVAKIMVPETERSESEWGARPMFDRADTNSLDALCRGAGEGMKLALNVLAMLIAFVAVVSLMNGLLTWPQTQLGVQDPVTLQRIFGWVNAPVAWLMGVPTKDCLAIGQVLGERIVLNEFIGYLSLVGMQAGPTPVDSRSFVLATYALCGFANFASIAVQIGGISSLAPSRRADLAKLGLRAMVGGLLSCYLTATVVGILI